MNKDFGYYISSDLTFTEHINVIINRALRALGFLKSDCLEFHNPSKFRRLIFLII